MFTASAALYDAIYAWFKDYPAEANAVASLLRRADPTAATILDVACGTGEHARLLTLQGFSVDGIDLDPQFVRLASARNPSGVFTVADMTRFSIDKRYDAVICLFSSIAYARTLAGVTATLRCFHEHVTPSGVIVVEPWFAPGRLEHGKIMQNEAEVDGIHVLRTSRLEVEGRLSCIRFEYEITAADGVHRASEIHELGLFTPGEMAGAFHDAGLVVEYDPDGLTGRGLYIARRRGTV